VRDHAIDLAIKGGGHSPNGSSSSSGGLVIDLARHFRSVSVDPAAKTVAAGGGCTWKDVDAASAPYGLACIGGTVSSTGIGGYSLHGGFGPLQGLYGLAVDNLLAVTIVTASGEVVHASAENEYSDLFWGVRGAGGNFGVVTEFVFRAHPVSEVFGGIVGFPVEKFEEIVQISLKVSNAGGRAYAAAFLMCFPPTFDPIAILGILYVGSEQEGREFFKEIFELDGLLMANVKTQSYAEYNNASDPLFPPMRRYTMKAGLATPPYSNELLGKLRSEWLETVTENTGLKGALIMIEMHDQSNRARVPVNATPFRFRDKANLMGLIVRYDDAALDAVAREFANRICKIVVDVESEKSGNLAGEYANFDPATEMVILPNVGDSKEDAIKARSEELYGSNYPRLQELKAKYDSTNLFNKWCVSCLRLRN
jgi:FAD/FMN-containing dehydrogenase